MRLVNKDTMKSRDTKANRLAVLAKIKDNYDKHRKEYGEAVEGYRGEVEDALDKMEREFEAAVDKKRVEFATAVARARAEAAAVTPDKPQAVVLLANAQLAFNPIIGLRPPVSHAEDYEVVIQTLEICVDDTVTLDTSEVEAYVMDRWQWTLEVQHLNSTYAAAAMSKRAK